MEDNKNININRKNNASAPRADVNPATGADKHHYPDPDNYMYEYYDSYYDRLCMSCIHCHDCARDAENTICNFEPF